MSNEIVGNPAKVNSDEMSQALDLLTRPIPQTMRLEVFERDFLPFFNLKGIEKEIVDEMLADLSRNHMGLKTTEKDLIHNLMNNWMSKVRSAYLPTDIVDRDGNVVYTVPAVLRAPDSPVNVPGHILVQLLETASNKYNVLPMEGNNFFRMEILPHVKTGQVTIEELQQWNKIFDHYGMPRYNIPGEETVNPQVKTTESSIDPDAECDYDFD